MSLLFDDVKIFLLVHIVTNLVFSFLLANLFRQIMQLFGNDSSPASNRENRLSRSGRIPLGVTLTFYSWIFRYDPKNYAFAAHTLLYKLTFSKCVFRGIVHRHRMVWNTFYGLQLPVRRDTFLICALVAHLFVPWSSSFWQGARAVSVLTDFPGSVRSSEQ